MSQNAAAPRTAPLLVGILRGKFFVWTPDKAVKCALTADALARALTYVGLTAATRVAHFASMSSPQKGGAPRGFRAFDVFEQARNQAIAAQ